MKILITTIFTLFLMLINYAYADCNNINWKGGDYMLGMMYGWGGGFGFIWMIISWLIFIFVVIAIIKWFSGEIYQQKQGPKNSALEILKERYAKGEINKKEFEEKKKDLS